MIDLLEPLFTNIEDETEDENEDSGDYFLKEGPKRSIRKVTFDESCKVSTLMHFYSTDNNQWLYSTSIVSKEDTAFEKLPSVISSKFQYEMHLDKSRQKNHLDYLYHTNFNVMKERLVSLRKIVDANKKLGAPMAEQIKSLNYFKEFEKKVRYEQRLHDMDIDSSCTMTDVCECGACCCKILCTIS